MPRQQPQQRDSHEAQHAAPIGNYMRRVEPPTFLQPAPRSRLWALLAQVYETLTSAATHAGDLVQQEPYNGSTQVVRSGRDHAAFWRVQAAAQGSLFLPQPSYKRVQPGQGVRVPYYKVRGRN